MDNNVDQKDVIPEESEEWSSEGDAKVYPEK